VQPLGVVSSMTYIYLVPTKKEKQPLSVTHPELAKEADGWDPETITFGMNGKLSWVCRVDQSHKWSASPNKRSSGRGCPFCSGNEFLPGVSDFKTLHPTLALEALGWDPSKFSEKSGKRKEWRCASNVKHIWETTISNRANGTGCPFCANKKVLVGENDFATMFPEIAKEARNFDCESVTSGSSKRIQWECSKNSQHIWSATVASRANGSGCPYCSHRAILEGESDVLTTHPELAEEAYGWDPKLYRAGSGNKLKWKCKNNSSHIWTDTPNNRKNNRGCPFCSGHQIMIGESDLLSTHTEIAREAFGWDPRNYSAGSNEKLKWKCLVKENHIWITSPSHRTRPRGCPYCSNKKVLVGDNDLATTHPELLDEVFGWDPTTVTYGSTAKRKWKCRIDGNHIWEAIVGNRAKGVGCPSCANSGFDPYSDGYLYFIEHFEWSTFQIGITNNPEDRLSKHKRLGWELLELRGPMDGHLTQQWETAILRMLKAKGADLSNANIAGKFDGYSEAWSKSTFEVKSIKELMRLTQEFEERD